MLQKIGQMIFFHEKMGDHNFLGLWLVMDDDVKWDATKKLSSCGPSKEKKKTTSVGDFFSPFPSFALWPNPLMPRHILVLPFMGTLCPVMHILCM